MEYSTQHSMGELRLHQMEMRQKGGARDSLFVMKRDERPMSVATEFVDMDWDEDLMSEMEENSPRHSVNSSGGQPSITTLSSYDEAPTPRHSPSQGRDIDAEWSKSVEGPTGPHLFRNSLIANLEEEAAVLTMSPITPKDPRQMDQAFTLPIFHEPLPTFHEPLPVRRQSGPFKYHHGQLDSADLADWTPEMVAQSMLDAGMEQPIAERFIENDISGAILITLKFEDLKELSIQSFGIRTKVWNQIQNLCVSRPSSPRAPTPIQDEPSREVIHREEPREVTPGLTRNGTRRRNNNNASHEDLITPLESVSIVGIEQVIPEPHFCSKGEKCSTYKKRQRIINELMRMNPNADLQSGAVVIAGDTSNPLTARALEPHETVIRPFSDAMNSVVASSDVLGPGSIPTLQYLQETTLRGLHKQDPQENVRQFLDFQQCGANEVPPTPPFEMAPCGAPKEGLRRLPRLAIPGGRQQQQHAPIVPSKLGYQSPQSRPQSQHEEDYQMELTESPASHQSETLYRFGTPFSEMDVPVTVVPMDRIERDISQSVPPEMNYRFNPAPQAQPQQQPPRTMSRASARRPSFPVMPALDENAATNVRTSPKATSPQRSPARTQQQQRQPLHAPPRPAFPWTQTPAGEATAPPCHIPLISLKQAAASSSNTSLNTTATLDGGVTYQGPMKKRRTRMLRHEWNDGYFTLKGTRLAMHKDALQLDRTLEYVDIDDYAIACSSLGSQSKLSAAFKRARLLSSSSSGSRDTDSVGAFAFQLIPQGKDGAAAPSKLRKRDSSFSFSSGGAAAAGPDGVNGTGKTHHFAVRNRDDRIDWMREMMLAKALRQKGEGFEVNVNGNQI